MFFINATWPHPDHVLVNVGQPAMDAFQFASGICIEEMMPPTADLVIVENYGWHIMTAKVRELTRVRTAEFVAPYCSTELHAS
jgi:hypothetical protein